MYIADVTLSILILHWYNMYKYNIVQYKQWRFFFFAPLLSRSRLSHLVYPLGPGSIKALLRLYSGSYQGSYEGSIKALSRLY
jgi:hypothetical protein